MRFCVVDSNSTTWYVMSFAVLSCSVQALYALKKLAAIARQPFFTLLMTQTNTRFHKIAW